MTEIALGINKKKLKPYNVMLLCSSSSEKRLLEQYFRIAEFNILEVDDKILNYTFSAEKETITKEKQENISNSKTDDDEIEEDEFSEEEMELNKILLSFDKTEILLPRFLIKLLMLRLGIG